SLFNIELGVAINPDTPNEKIAPYIKDVDFVQCMGIAKIGFQSQPFDTRVLDKIRSLRLAYPDLIISVDGGVSLETAPKLVEAGCNRLVSGSVIFNSTHIKETIAQFEQILNEDR
ncbi:ribulose-phosphate 3-epimerase, partial [Candidatus Parcubacteria bacterium]|nr:ribulose-phosphate 3-epimerase [Candidatus Parcubacteria bacterium]